MCAWLCWMLHLLLASWLSSQKCTGCTRKNPTIRFNNFQCSHKVCERDLIEVRWKCVVQCRTEQTRRCVCLGDWSDGDGGDVESRLGFEWYDCIIVSRYSNTRNKITQGIVEPYGPATWNWISSVCCGCRVFVRVNIRHRCQGIRHQKCGFTFQAITGQGKMHTRLVGPHSKIGFGFFYSRGPCQSFDCLSDGGHSVMNCKMLLLLTIIRTLASSNHIISYIYHILNIWIYHIFKSYHNFSSSNHII